MNATQIQPMVHELKCHPGPFQAVKDGSKPFEWRKDDRGYQVGDTLWLREWYPGDTPSVPDSTAGYTGDGLRRTVTYIIREGFGIPEGYCIMGLAAAKEEERSPTWLGHCSGCTDPHSEGTHQMGTIEHPDIDNAKEEQGRAKPVAWMTEGEHQPIMLASHKEYQCKASEEVADYLNGKYTIPLYTHPPTTGLDVEGVMRLVNEHDLLLFNTNRGRENFRKALEAYAEKGGDNLRTDTCEPDCRDHGGIEGCSCSECSTPLGPPVFMTYCGGCGKKVNWPLLPLSSADSTASSAVALPSKLPSTLNSPIQESCGKSSGTWK